MGLTFVLTWLFNNTKGSLLIAILAHASNDAFVVIPLFLAPIATSMLPLAISYGALALLLVVLTRGRLGYERYLQEEEEPDVATARA
jgi:hypothetical protein